MSDGGDRSDRSVGDSFLSQMIGRRRDAVVAQIAGLGPARLDDMVAAARPVRDLVAALTAGGHVAVIAEVKKASPSAGPIAPGVDAAAQARAYERGGAAAVSVLTEPFAFGGSFDDLSAVTTAVRLPVLCKDFVVDDAQVRLARGCGADGVLLMVSVFGEHVAGRIEVVRSLGMEPLVEVVSAQELDVAVRAGAGLVGVNARDLHTLQVDAARALEIVGRAKDAGLTTVLASGIKTAGHVSAAAVAGADAVLVGEALMGAPDPTAAVGGLARVRREVA